MRFAVLALALLAGCAGSGASVNDPIIQFVQVTSPGSLGFAGGRTSIEFELAVTNRSPEELTLDRVELRTVGIGAYTIRDEKRPMSIRVAPGATERTRFFVLAIARGGTRASTESVTIRGIAYFSSAGGAYQKLFAVEMSQNAAGGF